MHGGRKGYLHADFEYLHTYRAFLPRLKLIICSPDSRLNAVVSLHCSSIARHEVEMPEKVEGFSISRGRREPTPLGTTIFCTLRLLDPFLQRLILLSSPLVALAPNLGKSAAAPPTSGGPIVTARLGLTAIQTTIWAMTVGSAAKQIFWVLVTSNEPMYLTGAIFIPIFNTANNSLNTLLFTVAGWNPTFVSPSSVYIGAALYTIGILVEPIAEVQRKMFKDKLENQGKMYTAGLFNYARNINYGAYTCWRAGFALAAGGPVWGALVAIFFMWDFANRAIPDLEDYCKKKYGEQYKRVEKDVPYRLFPAIY